MWYWGTSCFLVAIVVLFLDLRMGEGKRDTPFCDVLQTPVETTLSPRLLCPLVVLGRGLVGPFYR